MAYPGASTFPGATTFPGISEPVVPAPVVVDGFDIRLRLYSSGGVKGKVLSTLDIDVSGVRNDFPTLRFSTTEKVAGFLPPPFVVAVEYTTGGAWIEPRNGRFWVEKDDLDTVKHAGEVKFTAQGIFAHFLNRTQVSNNSGIILENRRQFENSSAGAVFAPIFDDAKNAGHFPALSRDFTTTHDSFGTPWPAADKANLEYTIGTPLKSVLEALGSGGMCEWWAEGSVLRMAVVGTGTDRTSGSGVVRLGKGMDSAQVNVRTDSTKMFNLLTVIMEDGGYAYLANPGVASEWGALRETVSIRGASDQASAQRLAQPILQDGQASHRQIDIAYPAARARHLPWVHFNVADRVQAKLRGGWENLRVVDLGVNKDNSGVVSVTTVLSHRFRTLEARLAGRVSAGSAGGVVPAGTAPIPPSELVIMPPKAPTGLVVVSNVGWFQSDGTARSTVKVSWNPVTQTTDDANVDISAYEVWVAVNGGTPQRVRTVASTAAELELAPGVPVAITVRALSGPRVSQFSSALNVTPAVPLTVFDPPTAPSMSVKLGVVSATWDGQLTTGTPPSGFDYVYAEWATTSGGSYARFGGQLFGAGSVQLLGRPLASTVWVRFRVVSTVGVVSAPSTAASIVVVGVTGPDIEANSVTANTIAAGAIEAQHLTVGTRPAQGEAAQRVPYPLTDSVYWAKVVDGTIDLDPAITPLRVTATTSGVTLTPVTGGSSSLEITQRHPVPLSRKLHLTMLQSGTSVRINVRWMTSAGATVSTTTGLGGEVEAPTTAASYAVFLSAAANLTESTVVDAKVFEVIGGGPTSGAYTEISPRGFRSVSDAGASMVDLTANAPNFLSLQKSNGVGYVPVTTFDNDGGGVLQSLSVNNDINVRGNDLLGDYTTVLRNGVPDVGPIISRVSRGSVLGGFYSSLSIGQTYVDDYLSVASAQFTTDAGRRYMFSVDDTSYIFHNGAGGVVFAEVLISNSPINVNATTGYQVISSIAISPGFAQAKPFAMSRSMYSDTGVGSGAFRAAGTYLLLRFRLTATASMFYSNGAGSNALPSTISVVDIGPDFGMNVDYSDVKGSGLMTPPAQYNTVRTLATWSATYRNNGANRVVGSGQYDNSDYLYQGTKSDGPQGSWFGFPALGLSGKTITSAKLLLKNLSANDTTGITARLGTHGATTAPSTISGLGANPWTVTFGRAESKWVLLSSSLFAGLATGTIRGFTLGVHDGPFGYWQGGSSDPARPVLEVTYK